MTESVTSVTFLGPHERFWHRGNKFLELIVQARLGRPDIDRGPMVRGSTELGRNGQFGSSSLPSLHYIFLLLECVGSDGGDRDLDVFQGSDQDRLVRMIDQCEFCILRQPFRMGLC